MNLRRVLKVFGALAVVGVLSYAAYIGLFFYFMGKFEDVEIARYANPSDSMEAVVVERESNATVPTTTLIYIVPSKTKVPEDPHFLADSVDDLVVEWKDDRNVEIHVKNARVFHVQYYFSNKPMIELGNIRYKISSIGRRPE